jgi:4-amino-4-deoxy-L-arabinose transferase-like glycosyltransferase
MKKQQRDPPKREPARPSSRVTLVLLVGILVLAAVLRFVYLREVRAAPDFAFPQVDAEFHDYWARGLAFGTWELPAGKGDPRIQESPFFRPPGYPYFLAVIYKLAGPDYLTPRVVQVLLGLGNVLLAFWLVRKWLGQSVALVAALLMGTYWIFIYYEGEFLETPLMVCCTLLLLGLLFGWTERITFRRALAAGLVLGLSSLVRPNALIFLPAIAGWAYWIGRRQPTRRSFRLALGGLLLGCAVMILPATIRNYTVSGQPVLITSNAGINLYMGNNETADGRCPGSLPGLGKFKTCYDYPGIVANLEKRLGRRLNDSEVSSHFAGEAVRFMSEHPGRVVRLLARKALMFWGPLEVSHNKVEEAERDHSNVLSAIPGGFSVALALAITGAAVLFWGMRPPKGARGKRDRQLARRREFTVLVLLVIASWFLSFLPFFMAARYRVPIIPFLLAFGAYGLYSLGRFAVARDLKRLVLWGAIAVVVFLLVDQNWVGYRVDRARWHYARGMGYNASGELDLAMVEWGKALELNPTYVSAHVDLGIGLTLRGRHQEAYQHLRQAVQIDPNNAHAHFNLGAFLETQGRLDECREHYREALRINPAFRSAQEGLRRVTR